MNKNIRKSVIFKSYYFEDDMFLTTQDDATINAVLKSLLGEMFVQIKYSD